MVRTPNVVEDARENEMARQGRQGVLWLGAGLLIGAGLSFLVIRGDEGPEPVSTTVTVEETVPNNTVPAGIGQLIPGFPDGLVVTRRQEGESLDLLVWPEEGSPIIRSLPVGSESPPAYVRFDLSGRYLATILPASEGRAILFAGIPETASILAIDATGFAWHDAAAMALAYSTAEGSETVIEVPTLSLADEVVAARAVGLDGGLVAWGDWGYAVQDGEQLAVFDPNGEITGIRSGRALDSTSIPSGAIAVDTGGLSVIDVESGSSRPVGIVDGPILAAAFSPDGTLVAELTSTAMTVVDMDGDELAMVGERPGGLPQIAWSTDGAFVLYPARRGIVVVRVEDGATWHILDTEVLTGLVVPDRSQP